MQLSSVVPDAVLISNRTFEMGVALGLSGIIMKPCIGKCRQFTQTACT